MNYSKIKRKNQIKIFIVRRSLLLICAFIITAFIFGVIHLFGCSKVRAEPVAKTKTIVEEIVLKKPEPETKYISLGEYKLTAYCACEKCCGKCDGITASGVKAKEGVTIAADTRVLPFGTKVCIDGHEYIVQDRGGAIKGNKIDIYFDNHQEALNFGVQYKEIFMVKESVKYGQI